MNILMNKNENYTYFLISSMNELNKFDICLMVEYKQTYLF